MTSFRALALAAAFALPPLAARAADIPPPLPPEQISVEKTIKAGPNVFVSISSWQGAGSINVFSATDLAYKGNFGVGMQGQFALSPDASTGYVASAFPKRIMYGPVEVVLQSFDVATLATRQEVILSPKFAQISAQQGQLRVSDDGALAFVQNATPATSVTVANLKTGKATVEIPIPGCWQVHLAPGGRKFSSLCGDGSVLTVRVGPDGKAVGQIRSKPLFNVETDPLFAQSQRVDGDLMFMSYSGVLYRISDKGDAAELVDTFAFAKDVPGNWAPGGYAVMGYNAPNGIMFVLMHPDAKDGSHKDHSQEIWAVDVARKAVLYRSVAKGLNEIAVSQDANPVVFGVNNKTGGVYRFEVDPTARFAAKLTHELVVEDASMVTAR